LTRLDAARTYLELGIIAAARRDFSGAGSSFRRALRLEPTLTLPDTAGPDVVSAFSRVVKEAPPEAVQVSVGFEQLAGGEKLQVTARTNGQADGLTKSLLIEGGGLARRHALSDDNLQFVEDVPPPKECVTINASILDEYENRLWPNVAETRVCPPQGPLLEAATVNPNPESKAATATPDTTTRPIPAYVWIGVTVTGGLTALTGVFGVFSLNTRDEYHQIRDDPTYSLKQKADLRDRTVAQQNLATAFGIGAGSAAVATLVLYFTRPRVAAKPAAVLTLNPSAPGLALSGHF
jgi:hypothetical protein